MSTNSLRVSALDLSDGRLYPRKHVGRATSPGGGLDGERDSRGKDAGMVQRIRDWSCGSVAPVTYPAIIQTMMNAFYQ